MAQLNITLNQDEILQLLANDREEAFAKLLQDSLNSILKAESTAQLKAEPYERTEERTGNRNGFRDRSLTTRIGDLVLNVPKHRDGEPFHTMIFDNYSRSEAALILTMAEMVVNGVSTRKVSRVMETLCGTSYSKSTVSLACRDLDQKVSQFRNRPLEGEYPFMTLDATYFKVRENNRIISKAFMIAYATTEDGHREIIGFDVYAKESKNTWYDFLQKLKNRGLHGVKMITSDAHEGIRSAISKVYPETAWQRCQFHFTKNILDKTPKKYKEGLKSELQEMFNCKTIEEVRLRRDAIIADYTDVAEEAMTCLDEGFESAMSVMPLPHYLRKYFRTSNHLERLNRELKRRSKVIGVFPNEASLIRLMGAVLIEQNEVTRCQRGVFTQKTFQTRLIIEITDALKKIAAEQNQLSAA